MRTLVALAGLGTVWLAAPTAAAQWGQPAPGEPPPAQGQPARGQPPMHAGGLTPPSSGGNPNQQNQPATPTESQLEKADREDSGRGLEFFWLNAEVGFTHLGLQTFKANDIVDAQVVKTSDSGLLYGAGLGLRLVFITLGGRFRLANLSDYQLWTLNAELGIRIPLGDLEPYFTLGGGYASMGSFDRDNIGSGLNNDDVSITGYNIRGGFGIDYYITPVLSIGANLTGEMLGLTRPGVDPSKIQAAGSGGSSGGSVQGAADSVYAADGSSIGAAATVSGVVGLHF